MLDFQIQQAPMRLGLAEGVEPHQAPFGTLTNAENACWTKAGLLEKRLGTQAFTTLKYGGGSVAAAKRLLTRGDELCLIDGSNIYSRLPLGWVDLGTVPDVGITWETATVGLSTIRSADVAVGGGLITEAWVAGTQTGDSLNTLTYRVTDVVTRAIVVPPTVIANAKARPAIRVLSNGTTTWIVYAELAGASAGHVYVVPVGSAAVSVASNAPVAGAFGLDAVLVGTDILIAYSKSGGGIALLRVSVAAAPSVSASGIVTGETSASVATVSLSGAAAEPLFIAWATSGDVSGTDKVRFACANVTSLAQTLAPQDRYVSGGTFPIQTTTVACARYAASQSLLCYHVASQDIGTSHLYSMVVDSAGVVGNEGGSDRTFGVLSRPALIGDRWTVVVANYPGEAGVGYVNSTVLPTSETLLLDITPSASRSGITPVQLGKIECLTGSFWAPGVFANVSGGYVNTPFADAAPYGATGMVAKTLTGARRVRLVPGGGLDMWRSLSLGRESCFAAGMLCAYDGERARGWGFATGPLISTLFTSTVAAGGTIAAGRYLYNVTTERRSASGLLYRSPVGIASAVTTTGATSLNTIGIVASSLDRSDNNPGAHIVYRSTANGLVVQRIALPPSTMTLALGALATTVTDVQSDASAGLAIRPALYTEGGELEDMQPPSALTLAYYQSRIWLVAGDGVTVWFSKDRTVNTEFAPGFHPSLTLGFDRPVTALCPLDSQLIVFAADTLWALVGQGPAPNGQGGNYELVPIQTDVGCTNPRSVVSTPDGILFESDRGIYLLTRKLEVVWIGRPVKDELATHTQITSAVLVAKRSEIRFTATDPIAVRSIVLVYNYVEQQWTTSKYTVDGVYGAAIADACMWQGQWTAVSAAGTVFSETEANALDVAADTTTAWVPMTIETAWVSAAGPLTFQSVRNFSFEGIARSPHTLSIAVGFDSDPSYPQTATFAVTGAGVADSRDVSIGTRRKCHAIRFRISDAAPIDITFGGGGMSLAILGIEVGAKKGFAKKPKERTG